MDTRLILGGLDVMVIVSDWPGHVCLLLGENCFKFEELCCVVDEGEDDDDDDVTKAIVLPSLNTIGQQDERYPEKKTWVYKRSSHHYNTKEIKQDIISLTITSPSLHHHFLFFVFCLFVYLRFVAGLVLLSSNLG